MHKRLRRRNLQFVTKDLSMLCGSVLGVVLQGEEGTSLYAAKAVLKPGVVNGIG